MTETKKIYEGCFRNFVAFKQEVVDCAPGCSLSAGPAVSLAPSAPINRFYP